MRHYTSFVVVRMADGGVPLKNGVVERMQTLSDRLQGVVIEQLPYERVLKNQDGPDTFFFCDPPYVGADVDQYEPFTEAQMTTLRDRLAQLRGRWLLTVNDSPFTRQLFAGHPMKPITAQNRASNNTNLVFGELLIQDHK